MDRSAKVLSSAHRWGRAPPGEFFECRNMIGAFSYGPSLVRCRASTLSVPLAPTLPPPPDCMVERCGCTPTLSMYPGGSAHTCAWHGGSTEADTSAPVHQHTCSHPPRLRHSCVDGQCRFGCPPSSSSPPLPPPRVFLNGQSPPVGRPASDPTDRSAPPAWSLLSRLPPHRISLLLLSRPIRRARTPLLPRTHPTHHAPPPFVCRGTSWRCCRSKFASARRRETCRRGWQAEGSLFFRRCRCRQRAARGSGHRLATQGVHCGPPHAIVICVGPRAGVGP